MYDKYSLSNKQIKSVCSYLRYYFFFDFRV